MAEAQIMLFTHAACLHTKDFSCQFSKNRCIAARPLNAAIKSNGNISGNGVEEDSRLEILFSHDTSSDKSNATTPTCPRCMSRGDVLCLTCSGTGLYVEAILESQGIIAKVKCLGCGGVGKIMCPHCGGRGHT